MLDLDAEALGQVELADSRPSMKSQHRRCIFQDYNFYRLCDHRGQCRMMDLRIEDAQLRSMPSLLARLHLQGFTRFPISLCFLFSFFCSLFLYNNIFKWHGNKFNNNDFIFIFIS
jgi:hypothetical protein